MAHNKHTLKCVWPISHSSSSLHPKPYHAPDSRTHRVASHNCTAPRRRPRRLSRRRHRRVAFSSRSGHFLWTSSLDPSPLRVPTWPRHLAQPRLRRSTPAHRVTDARRHRHPVAAASVGSSRGCSSLPPRLVPVARHRTVGAGAIEAGHNGYISCIPQCK